MASFESSQRRSMLLDQTERAHKLIDQFLTRTLDQPERAWESVAELQQLMEQLQALYPAKTFRRKPD
jgi:hypothetical protein